MNIIEVGAFDGYDTLIYSQIKNSKVWCFEPVPELYEYLTYRFKDNDNVIVINKAVSNFNGKAIFNIATGTGSFASSSLYKLSQFGMDNTCIKFVEEVEVDVIRMDTFLNEYGIDKIDYFHCDAQGNDYKVLKSFGDKLSIIEQGQVEVDYKGSIYDSDNSIEKVIDYLKYNNFKITNINQQKTLDTDIKFVNKKNKFKFI
jgi:FkbM family methyltransferase